ncbi:T9SS type A sorting domain-containing protein [Chitinophaga sp. LS1]
MVSDQQTQHQSKINIGKGLPAGLYFIQISTKNAAVTKKIVIQ